ETILFLGILMGELSVLIKNTRIVDGSGKEAYEGSIGIKEDKIVSIGKVKGDAVREIDAKGLLAVPGFIDSHSHGDFGVMFFPKCESYLHQGVTTMIVGQCGMSLAPIGDYIRLPGIASDYLMEIEPHKYYPKRTVFPRGEVNDLMKEKFGWTVDWSSMDEWFKAVEKIGISMNMATLVGHSSVRHTVLKDDYERSSTDEEIAEMSRLIEESMDAGCYGMSVGLDYDPDTFADKKEIVEHCKIIAKKKGIFAPHSRRTGRRRNIGAGHRQHDKIEGIYEILDICRESGVKMNIAHLFTGWYVNPQGYPSIFEEANRKATLAVIDKAIDEGMDVSFDVLPSAQVSKFGGASYLCSSFSPWLREKGSREEFAKWLKIPDYRQEIKDAIKSGKWFIRVAYNPNTNPRWAENYIILEHKNKEAVNKTIADIAEMREQDAFDVWFDLIVEDPDAKCGQQFVYPSGTYDPDAGYHKIFWEHPTAALGIDTGVDDYKYESKSPPWMLPRINAYAAFPGFFQKFVKRDKVFTVEQAVFKTSTQAAIRHEIKGRGVIKKGAYADILLMDLKKLKVTGTPLKPRQKPSGIEYVLVNGVPVVEKKKHSNLTPGRVLRKGRDN
ncbi:MAG: amidohydrolase family protein, partial [Candidatus Bathyarchaeota archaeon]|nr:amidohydrolase family protein [Candidatus Bathyarchaeota archaeon]